MSKKLIVATALALVVLLGTAACSPPVQSTQGYESPQGYQEPDHSWLYTYMLYNLTFGSYQPSYHVYVVPSGYPSYYRPWYPSPTYRPTYQAPVYTAPPRVDTRTTGGFQNAPKTNTVAPGTTTRTSGGFSPAPTPAASPRQSGGFSAPSTPSAPRSTYTPPPTRSSGGFSAPSRPSSPSPRSSGGFGKR